MSTIHLKATIPDSLNSHRLDQALAQLFPQYSRAQHQTWIRNGQVTVNGQVLRPRDKVQTEQVVQITAELEQETGAQAQAIPLHIIYEDASLIVVDKPAGLVAHPGAGNRDKTLVNALLHFDSALKLLPRAGMIHRLDKETSGLLAIARNLESYHSITLSHDK